MTLHVPPSAPDIRHDWTESELRAIHDAPFNDLLYRAQTVHRRYFDPNRVQKSQLLSIKTGGCPEDCSYCSQSAHYKTGVASEKLMAVETVLADARRAKANGATRYCMGAAWKGPAERHMDTLCAMVEGVKALGLETCMTLGRLSPRDANRLAVAGLDFYNHNLDTSEAYYKDIVSTHSYADRLATLAHVREAGMKVCCGGILGMGEENEDRIALIATLAGLRPHPESVPINMLMPMAGTPLENVAPVDPISFVRAVATARIAMPQSYVRLSAGRTAMSDELQALCFFAGANSIFAGDRLLTAANPGEDADGKLFARLGLGTLQPQ